MRSPAPMTVVVLVGALCAAVLKDSDVSYGALLIAVFIEALVVVLYSFPDEPR